MSKRVLLSIVLLVCVLQITSALPNSGTSASGNVCTRKHSLYYSYSVTAPKTVEVGDTFQVSLDFSLKAESRLSRAPTETTATLSGSKVELISNPLQQCSSMGVWQLKATDAGTAKLKFATDFFIDGNNPTHRRYKANFKDTVDFTIDIIEKPVEVIPEIPKNLTNLSENPINNSENPVNISETVTNTTTYVQTIDVECINETQVIDVEFEGEIAAVSDASWITTRIVGFLAYIALFISVLTGLLKRAGYKRAMILFKYHHDISILSLILTFFHALSNIFDKYTWNLLPYEAFFPQFASDTQLWLSLGILGFYLMVAVTLTSLGGKAIRKVGIKNWRYIHMSSYIAFIFAFSHALLLGTDLQEGPLLYTFIFSGIAILTMSMDIIITKVLGGKNE